MMFESRDTPPTIRLRDELRRTDITSIERIVRSTDFFNPPEIEIAIEVVSECLERGAASGYHAILADCETTPIADIVHGPIPCTVASFDIYWIAVSLKFQRQQLGQRLLKESETRIQQSGGRAIYIDTSGREQYRATRCFYERCGYQVAAEFPEFYAPYDAKIVYRKWLSTTK